MRTLLRVLGGLILATLILLVAVFFWFQSYIVHTLDGVRLDIPFLRGILDDIPYIIEDEPELPDLPFLVLPVIPETPEPDEPPTDLPPFRSVFLAASDLEGMPDVNLTLEGFRADAVLLAVNDETGRLWWTSDTETAVGYQLYGTGEIGEMLEDVGSQFSRSALLVGFHNELLATRNPAAALDGFPGWVNPQETAMRDYVMDLGLELARLGFDEIVLTDFAFPLGYPTAEDAVILDFLQDFAAALATLDVSLSVLTHEHDWYDPDGGVYFRPALYRLADVVVRFYCILEPRTLTDGERYDALMAAVQSVLGGGTGRFVPVGTGSGPDEGNWTVRVS